MDPKLFPGAIELLVLEVLVAEQSHDSFDKQLAEAALAALPPVRDDEPASLRRDILDELRDHLACAFRSEHDDSNGLVTWQVAIPQVLLNPAIEKLEQQLEERESRRKTAVLENR